jgi:DNA-binding MarR family transcriptional regulator
MSNLNQEEKDILNSVENGEWNSINQVEKAKQIYQSYAQEYLEKSIKIVLSREDEQKLSDLANQLGTSPSSLTEDILHKYLQGLLVDKTA